MIDWIKRLVGRAPNQLGKSAELLAEHLARLEHLDGKILEQAARFVLTGSGASVLDVLRADTTAGQVLGLYACGDGNWDEDLVHLRKLQGDLVQAINKQGASVEVFSRLGQLWEAAADGGDRQLALTGSALRIPAWLETLHDELAMATSHGTGRAMFDFLDAGELSALLARRGENPDSVIHVGLGIFWLQPHGNNLHVWASRMLHLAGCIRARPQAVKAYFDQQSDANERFRTVVILLNLLGDDAMDLLQDAVGLKRPEVARIALGVNTDLLKEVEGKAKNVLRKLVDDHDDQMPEAFRQGGADRFAWLQKIVEMKGAETLDWLEANDIDTAEVVEAILGVDWTSIRAATATFGNGPAMPGC